MTPASLQALEAGVCPGGCVRPGGRVRQPGGADLPQGHPGLREGRQHGGQHVEWRDHEQQDQGVARRHPARRSPRLDEGQEAEEGEEHQ